MDENSPQPESSSDNSTSESSPQSSGSFADKAKQFFTMGGDKEKWKKAIIAGIIAAVVCGLLVFAFWGMAIWAMAYFRGEPNGNSFTADGNYQIIKTMDVNVTTYSPHMGSNDCDKSTGGSANTADGNGKFVFQNGKIQWVSKTKTLDHIFAEPVNYSIIPWNLIDQQAVQIPGFMGDIPYEIHDVYAGKLDEKKNVISGNHVTSGQIGNFLDFSYTCGEGATIDQQLKAVQKSQGVKQTGTEGTTVRVNIVQNNLSGGLTGSHSEKILTVARKQLGYIATNDMHVTIPPAPASAHGNCNKYSGSCEQWCADFASWVYKQAGYWQWPLNASAQGLVSDRAHLKVIQVNCDPKRIRAGDIFGLAAPDGHIHHVGIVESVDVEHKQIHSIEGNTSQDVVKREFHDLCGIKDPVTYVARPLTAN
ncbi:MAG: CHAP domain-containing protein [Candidatus Berkelbacteria bacterium]|nr:CHAP domain-containing protein [Candidatus Berkelbacteria bacterium]